MARRVVLHVGLPKTGTTFLQDVLWSNRRAIERQGLLVPGIRPQHYRSSLYVRDVWRRRPNANRIVSDWQWLVEQVRGTREDALITHELFAPATAEQARRAIEALGGEETHVVITARDLARQVPAEWQQSVKEGSKHRLEDYIHDVEHRGPRARWFWKVQDLVDVAQRWGGSLPDSHVHLVTVPPKGADPSLLWSRFASVLGVDPASVTLDRSSSNESLGRVEVELLRRMNELRAAMPADSGDQSWFKKLADETLAKRPGKEKFAVDESMHSWICKTAQETIAALREREYDVVGDLDDLIPPEEPERGGDPSKATEGEMLLAATETVIDLVVSRHRPDQGPARDAPARIAPAHNATARRAPTSRLAGLARRLRRLVRAARRHWGAV